ncbi:hypothetical protein MHC_02970 [Mycoplasma haemocanis str. Illinois]|uniref:Uncharacterized protein n=1 Tax=Mycoplasma haemocanis (strain Illinois) TaxID=1111676 RepID=H6N734_MYCHN|nr:hypothetical protein [Mycoplasma haemocanis]AEW45456.1 hypothetical protein MHC_02970 [Mycoplasma haemocanis str. Illinois]
MNTLIPKAVALVASLGGAIAVLFETKNSSSPIDLLSAVDSLTAKPKKRVPNKSVCNIFEAEYNSIYSAGNTYSRKLQKIEERFWTKDEFLKEVEEKGLWNKDDLKSKIETACSQNGKKAFVEWYYQDHSKPKTWVYNDKIDNNVDWLNDSSVDMPKHWVEEWSGKNS